MIVLLRSDWNEPDLNSLYEMIRINPSFPASIKIHTNYLNYLNRKSDWLKKSTEILVTGWWVASQPYKHCSILFWQFFACQVSRIGKSNQRLHDNQWLTYLDQSNLVLKARLLTAWSPSCCLTLSGSTPTGSILDSVPSVSVSHVFSSFTSSWKLSTRSWDENNFLASLSTSACNEFHFSSTSLRAWSTFGFSSSMRYFLRLSPISLHEDTSGSLVARAFWISCNKHATHSLATNRTLTCRFVRSSMKQKKTSAANVKGKLFRFLQARIPNPDFLLVVL